jgi:phosphoglycerol transferase MdoB-like AlkP superfamily enzyme
MGIGAKKILDNRQVVMTLDHDVQNKSAKVDLLPILTAESRKIRQYRTIRKGTGS